MARHFGYRTKKRKEMHYDAHVTNAHITARNKREALKKAKRTVKVRES